MGQLDQTLRPTNITLDKTKHELRVEWIDNHISGYPLDALREACPCAECRGGHEFMGREHDPMLLELKPSRAYMAQDVQIVGNYALQFFWDDGHTAGIYTWAYLRRLCPCESCQSERAAS